MDGTPLLRMVPHAKDSTLPAKDVTPTLWTEWMTDRCRNIIFPQTSFAGGNKANAKDE